MDTLSRQVRITERRFLVTEVYPINEFRRYLILSIRGLIVWETMIYLKRPNCFCLMNVDLDAALLIWLPNLNSKWALAMKLIESNHSGGLSHG